MKTRSRDLTLGFAAAALLLPGLVGCTDDEDPGAVDAPSSSSVTDPAPSPTDETTEPTEPTEEAEEAEEVEGVEPATGPRVVTKRFSFRGPEKWVVTGDKLPFVDLERDPGNKIRLAEPHGIISVIVLPSGRSFTLEQLVSSSDPDGRRLDDIDLDGEVAYHFSESDRLQSDESFGLWREPFESIQIRFGTFGTTRAEREALVASVLATWKWRR